MCGLIRAVRLCAWVVFPVLLVLQFARWLYDFVLDVALIAAPVVFRISFPGASASGVLQHRKKNSLAVLLVVLMFVLQLAIIYVFVLKLVRPLLHFVLPDVPGLRRRRNLGLLQRIQ